MRFTCHSLTSTDFSKDWVIQAARFSIIEQVGCQWTYGESAISIAFMDALPLLPAVLACIYVRKYASETDSFCANRHQAFIVTRLLRASRDLNKVYSSTGTVTSNHYTRLVAISCWILFLTLPREIANAALDIIQEESFGINLLHSFPGWKEAHSGMSNIILYSDAWRTSEKDMATTYFGWASDIALAYSIFLLFGTTREMCTVYLRIFSVISRPLGFKPSSKGELYMSDMKFEPPPMAALCVSIIDLLQ